MFKMEQICLQLLGWKNVRRTHGWTWQQEVFQLNIGINVLMVQPVKWWNGLPPKVIDSSLFRTGWVAFYEICCNYGLLMLAEGWTWCSWDPFWPYENSRLLSTTYILLHFTHSGKVKQGQIPDTSMAALNNTVTPYISFHALFFRQHEIKVMPRTPREHWTFYSL